jgi:hypothetical protein
MQAVVERRDVHQREASGVSDGDVAEEGHVLHAAEYAAGCRLGDQQFVGP